MSDKAHYIILHTVEEEGKYSHAELAKKVNEKLAEGYEPLGAPFVDDYGIYQAMLKPAKAGDASGATMPPDLARMSQHLAKRR